MDRILTGNIWNQVKGYARTAKQRIVAVAYVSTENQIGLRRNDLLICDASEMAIKNGETSASLLNKLHRRGVLIRSLPKLHAKAAIFGRYALVGSCNLSGASANELIELALITDRKQVVAQTEAIIQKLKKISKKIDSKYLRRILKIKPKPIQKQTNKVRRKSIPLESKFWLVSVKEISDDYYPKEKRFINIGKQKSHKLIGDNDKDIAWIRITGKSRFRTEAQQGDTVIQIMEPLSGKSIKVLPPSTIIYRQDIANWTRFYLYNPESRKSMNWHQLKRLTKQLRFSRLSKYSVRQLSDKEVMLLEDIWKAL